MNASPEPDFDLVAASLRADTSDLNAYVEALAVKLEGALPTQTVVERRSKGLLSREKTVRKIEVDAGETRYLLERTRSGQPDCRRAKAVRGIVLSSEQLALDGWIEALARDLTAHAAASEQGRLALERLLV